MGGKGGKKTNSEWVRDQESGIRGQGTGIRSQDIRRIRSFGKFGIIIKLRITAKWRMGEWIHIVLFYVQARVYEYDHSTGSSL
jgi:hypothetical protein